MKSGETSSRFKTTSWTLIGEAQDSRAELERLLIRYWSPVYAFLRRSGQSNADAEDLTQAFLASLVLQRDLLAKADRSRGRFRSFLITSLKRFVIDEFRRERGRDGNRPAMFMPDDPQALSAAEPSEQDPPEHAFHRQWATAVLDRAVQGVEASCLAGGMERQWTAFDERVLRPAQQGCEPTPIPQLVDRLEATGPQEIYSMLQTVKNKLKRELWAVVSETVESADDVQHELKELAEFLALPE